MRILTCISYKLLSGVRQTVILDESKLFEGKVCKPFQENGLCSDEMTDVAVHPDVCEKSRLTCISYKLCSKARQTVIPDGPELFDGKVCKPCREKVLRAEGLTDVGNCPEVCEKYRFKSLLFFISITLGIFLSSTACYPLKTSSNANQTVTQEGMRDVCNKPSLRHVYLTWELDTSTSMTINVHHLESGRIQIYYDENPHFGNLNEYKYSVIGVGTPFLEGKDKRYIFHVNLTELTPGEKYHFVITDEGEAKSEEKSFRTIPLKSKSYRFASGGDWEITEAAKRVALQAAKCDPLAVFLGGDYPREVNKIEDFPQWDKWLDMYTSTMQTTEGCIIPMVMAIGNQDVFGNFDQSPDKAPFFYEYFRQNPEEKSYFYKHFGEDITLFILDSGHTSTHRGEQKKWLKKHLNAFSDKPIKFAIYHVPIYPSVRFKHPSFLYKTLGFFVDLKEDKLSTKLLSKNSLEGEKQWAPLFDTYDLTAAFEHHDQTLKRTKLLKGGRENPLGTLYLGDGGWGPEKQFLPIQSFLHSYFLKTKGHIPFFWLIDVSENHIIYRAISDQGKEIDKFKQNRGLLRAVPI